MDLNRREFLSYSAMTSTAILFSEIAAYSKPLKSLIVAPGFEVLVLATNWGFDGNWDEFCSKINSLGYDGAEVWYPSEEKSRKEFLSAFESHKLKFGFLIGGSDRDPAKHLQQFKLSLEGAVALNPLYINCHSGKDYFTFEQNRSFIDLTTEVSGRTGVPVYHETHRSRILYSAPVARQYMEQLPALRLTLDISHWCNVHESLLDDQQDTIALALSRTGHIHARVGHSEGPQVSDPRAPEWQKAVQAHFAWWDKVVENKRREGKRITMLTEFGPIDYMPSLPYTRQPVANQWEINKYMLDTLKARYSA
jgi:sugar phosphate isomerase/epimerase